MHRPEVNPPKFPDELRQYEHWLCWRKQPRAGGKIAKIPVSSSLDYEGQPASVTDPDTWSEYTLACLYFDPSTKDPYRNNVDGLGFVLSEADPFIGVDLDDCVRVDGTIEPWAAEIVERIDSYTEFSPSLSGLHILAKASTESFPDSGLRRDGVEMYRTNRYFTITGFHLEGTPETIEWRDDAISELAAELRPEVDSGSSQGVVAPTGPVSLEDEALIEKAKNAKNGAKFSRLWNGNTSGYASASEADQALCCQLAFWAAGDGDRIDHLFRQSGLFRDKWDERHYADGRTYGEVTIATALKIVDNYYEY